ncbi:MAG: hypothetical protein ACRCXD_07455 [Luteolibacter sp.]
MQIITTEEINSTVTAFVESAEFQAQPEAEFDFCTAWPVAKQVLQLLSAIPAYGWVVKLVIAVGEAYFRKKCPN